MRGMTPDTTPTIQCRQCSGDGRQLVEIPVGTRHGRPVYRLTPQDCTHCDGLGYLTYRRRPASRPMPMREVPRSSLDGPVHGNVGR
ncbi:hypothetical protein FB566_1474 [Stackebrandtia endophytica]|uniref:Uncharacterized protein n=1 Tax=Stackebrandtia endophytica TaxID=1496996 RepID=A0A543ATV1_9ACTN|nr:hypothetical protein FB566_1474 [Stackebrandtia endophytica]